MTDRIYYADHKILDIIRTEFNLIDDKEWHQLYQHKINKTY
jgi:hypothetical protein